MYVIYQISGKIESKKRLSEILGGKMEIFSYKKVIRKFPSPQSRRQVSANGIRLCKEMLRKSVQNRSLSMQH